MIPSVPGAMASSLGRVMFIPKTGEMPHGGLRQYGGFPTYGAWAKNERRFIWRINGTTYRVARLVCEAFNGAKPFANAVVMHVDENSKNNKPSNLRWGTQKENLNAPGFITYCKSRTGTSSPTIKGLRRAA